MVAAFKVDPPGEKRTEAVVEVPGTIERPSVKSVFSEVAPVCQRIIQVIQVIHE